MSPQRQGFIYNLPRVVFLCEDRTEHLASLAIHLFSCCMPCARHQMKSQSDVGFEFWIHQEETNQKPNYITANSREPDCSRGRMRTYWRGCRYLASGSASISLNCICSCNKWAQHQWLKTRLKNIYVFFTLISPSTVVLLHESSFWKGEQWRTSEVVEPRDDFPMVPYVAPMHILLTKACQLT